MKTPAPTAPEPGTPAAANPPSAGRFPRFPQLTVRAVLIGMLGSLIITASSMYVALRMSALPWPTIFVAVLSMALLKILGRTDLHEINIAQTGMSAGAMVAGGLAFTIPGLWISGLWQSFDRAGDEPFAAWFWPKFWPILLIATGGMLLGAILCWLLRPRFIDEDKLPYPIGAAAAETIIVGDEGGHKAIQLFVTMGLSALFTALRDKFGWIPQAVGGAVYAVALSPMAAGIGYIIGFALTAWWFGGALISNTLLPFLQSQFGWFAGAAALSGFITTSAIGLMVGSGVGILISFLIGLVRRKPQLQSDPPSAEQSQAEHTGETRHAPVISRARPGKALLPLLATALAFVATVMAGLSAGVSVLVIIGTFAATAMAANITGLTGINPMEIFGIIILLAIRLFLPVSDTGAFFIAAIVAVACGFAGDLMNDYKAGAIIGSHPDSLLVSQLFGGVVGTVVASVALLALVYQYGSFGKDAALTATQAQSVTAMIRGIGDPTVFFAALAIGCVLYLLKVPAMIVGIGMLLPFGFSAAFFIGGLIRLITDLTARDRAKIQATGNIIASGLLGGEGITGVILAFLAMIS